MNNWQEVKLGDVCEINKQTYSLNENWQYAYYLDTGNITENKIEEIQFIDLNFQKLPSRAKRKVEKDNIIYSTVRPNQLHYGIIKSKPNNFLVSTGFSVLSVNKLFVDASFIYYFLTQKYLTEKLQAIAEQSVSAYPSIKPSDIANITISLPPLEVQKKIAGVLGALDDKIELNNKINQNLEAQAQALFKSWFVDFEPFGGKMPDDWKIGKLGNFIEIKRGGSPRPIQNYISTSGLKWLKISDATSEISPYILTIKECIKPEGLSKTVKLDAGSLVLSNSATPGIPKILDIESCIHDGWLYFPKSSFSNEYLYLLFKYIRNDLISLGNGSVFTNLKTDILKNFGIVIPSISALNDFNKIIVSVFALIRKNRREIKNLIELRDTLLPKLMSGEINVNDGKID